MENTTTPPAPTFDDLMARGYISVKIGIPATATIPAHEEELTVMVRDMCRYFLPSPRSENETGGFAG